MDSEKRLELIVQGTEEVLTKEDLMRLIENNSKLKHYIGFEISGKVHLGTGIASMLKVMDFLDAKADCSVFLADWHSWINNKLSGNLEEIGRIGVNYFKEAMIASLECVQGDEEKLKFVLGSELYHNNDAYWQCFVDVSKNISLARIMRSITIMGKKEGESVEFGQLLYPPMQVADIFIQGLNIAHAGMDQRKAHVLAREVAMQLKFSPLKNSGGEQVKPIAVHQPLLLGLQKPSVWPIEEKRLQEVLSEQKMSKSIPSSCVFVHDSEQVIREKIQKAFCMEKEIAYNPILDWVKKLIFRTGKGKFLIERENKFGGTKEYLSYSELEKDFVNGSLHPVDLKNALANWLIEFLKPARKRFEKPKQKKMLEEMDAILAKRNQKN